MSETSPPSKPFFVTGGTLHLDATSYVTRQADTQLLETLLKGETCFVLNSRQMGKSSLCVRTIAKLNQQNVTTVFLDLTKFGGSNLSPEQWYAGLLSETGRAFGLRKEFLAYWKEQAQLSPLQRLFGAIQEVALAQKSESIVIFIDEIDVTRSLPFSADEFFGAIRQCYVGRAQEPRLSRLAFCLLGTATPAELIQDTRVSPFNVGKRIELADFTSEEALALAGGLRERELLLNRILYWTNGHPYLTQRLCLAVAESASPDVDRICREMFLTRTARESDDNLMFVRNRLLKSDVELAGLLELLGRIRAGKRVSDDEVDPLKGVIKLSGVARAENGELRLRNRIYAEVFDRVWIEAQMPDAELRRQRIAYRQGLVRALTGSGLIIAVVATLAIVARDNARKEHLARAEADNLAERQAETLRTVSIQSERITRALARVKAEGVEVQKQKALAEKHAKQADKSARERLQALNDALTQKGIADSSLALAKSRLIEANVAKSAESTAKQEARKQLARAESASYIANMNLIQRDWENNNVGRVLELLEESRSYQGRGFEWGYWNRLCHTEMFTLEGHANAVNCVALSPDGRRIVTGSRDSTAKVWDFRTGRELLTLRGHSASILTVAFSSDGRRIFTGSEDKTVRTWDSGTGKPLLSLNQRSGSISCLSLSSDGRRMVKGVGNTAIVWGGGVQSPLFTLKGHIGAVRAVAFSPDGKRIATVSEDATAKVWDAQLGKELISLRGHSNYVTSVGFSSDGRRIVTGSWDKTAKVWDATTGAEILTLKGHTGYVHSVAFSTDGERVVTGSDDNTTKLWDSATGDEILTLKGHTEAVHSVVFSPDGKRIVTGSDDSSAKVWDATIGGETPALNGYTDYVNAIALSPRSRRIVTGGRGKSATVWDSKSGEEYFPVAGHTREVVAVAFSPDGKRIVTGSHDRTAKVWDALTGKEIFTLSGHAGYVTSVAFSPDGRRIATGSHDKTAKVWDALTGKPTLTKEASGEVACIAFSSDGRRIATGERDGTAQVWDSGTGKPLLTLMGHYGALLSIAFSADGGRIFTGSVDKTAVVWDGGTGKPLLALRGHSAGVDSVALSPDGKRIATGSLDSTVKVWESEAGKELLTIKGSSYPVYLVLFSADGKSIVTGTADGTAQTWGADFEAGRSVGRAR